MMLWNKIKIAAALVCVVAVVGTGSGWLARGRNAVETSLPAAEPPAKKQELFVAVPDPADKIKSEIKKIHAEMDYLAEKENDREEKLAEEAIEARLNLMAMQDALRLREQEWDFEREQEQERLKAAAKKLSDLQNAQRYIEKNMDKKSEAYKERRDHFIEAQKSAADQLESERTDVRNRERQRIETIRSLRRRVFKAESDLRRIESHQERQREEHAERRQALLLRVQQLENKKLNLEPADRLRDVERKLDALRREVGELRRALEKSTSPQRKQG